MKIDVVFCPDDIGDLDRNEHIFVVIDVLRACSTIITALSNGCQYIILIIDPVEGLRMKKTDDVILAGERNGIKLNGYDLGNSPAEFTRDRVRRKTVVMCSTNGTKAIEKSKAGAESIIAAFLNIQTVIEYIRKRNKNVTILCSGKLGRHSLEDTICAGMIVENLDAEYTDTALIAEAAYKNYKNSIYQCLKICEHGKYLAKLGFAADLKYCSQIDIFKLLPKLDPEGRIVEAKT